jgi:hypothetical protein
MDRRYRKRMAAYWARAEARARRKIDALDLSSWFDFWHTHVDWYGRGNAHIENRADVAASTVRVLRHLEERAGLREEPFQVWATLCNDTMDNAVYAHSPNPNGTAYPEVHRGVLWGAPVPKWVSAAVDAAHEVGAFSRGEGFVYVVRRRLTSVSGR